MPSGPWHWRAVLPLIGLVLLGTAVSLNVWTPSLYTTIMSAILAKPGAGLGPSPFWDLDYLLMKTTCWQQGVNVYVRNPCDLFIQPMDYSPLWLRMQFLALDRSWAVPLGIGLAALFCLSFAALVPSARWRVQVVIGLASFSPVSVFAVERANMDIIIYLFSLLSGIALAARGGVRFTGYGLLLGAGLLKFYPVVALVVVVRERLTVCLGLVVASVGIIAGFSYWYYDELTAAIGNIWSGAYFADHIGFKLLPGGIVRGALQPIFAVVVGEDWGATAAKSRVLGYVVASLLMLSLCTFVVWTARSAERRHSVSALPPRYGALLQIGAVLMVGCFFAGESVGYRGIMLLLTLPGLVLLGRPEVSPRLRLLSRFTVVLILLTMFRIPVTGALAAHNLKVENSAWVALLWVSFELAWWWIVSFLLALLTSSILESTAWRETRALLSPVIRGCANRQLVRQTGG
jgi:hypothetical protein